MFLQTISVSQHRILLSEMAHFHLMQYVGTCKMQKNTIKQLHLKKLYSIIIIFK